MERHVEDRNQGGEQQPNPEELLGQLKSEHAMLEARLAELDSHLSLTSEEQVERVRVKKLKLAKKDQIMALSAQLRR